MMKKFNIGGRRSMPKSDATHSQKLFKPRDWVLNVFKITSKKLSLSDWNFVTFSIYPIDAFWNEIQVNDITASYNDIIAKMAVQVLQSNSCWNRKKWYPYKILSKQDIHLKLWQNVSYMMGNTFQKMASLSFSLFFYCSQTIEQ